MGARRARIVGNRIVSGDLDGDGYPDLVIHAIGSNNREAIAHGRRLLYVLMNEPGPSGGRVFVDRTDESGYASLHERAGLFYHSAQLAALADIDNDGDLDIFSGVYTAPDQVKKPPTDADLDRSRVLLNDGAGHFSLAAASDASPTKGMPTIGASFSDVDRDGVVDLFVGFHDSGSAQNEQSSVRARRMRLPRPVRPALPPGRDGTFEELGESMGFHHPCTSGLTVADFDRDGDLDLVVGSGTARDCADIWDTNEVHLYENDASTRGHWLVVRLLGDGLTANRSALGARVVAEAGGLELTKELDGSYGHMSMENDTVLFFGLGGCGVLDALEVTWPDAARTTERFEGIPTDRVIELRQGDPEVHDATPIIPAERGAVSVGVWGRSPHRK